MPTLINDYNMTKFSLFLP